ncbi:MAG: UDP-N-acetylglucosamine 2-epimerase (hydrolyzing) [Desulfamplus sp.]|nr:UDP-N-acetylglucosamine 2-epimerase (hydrolyzing) [Desulfamplus sp.]
MGKKRKICVVTGTRAEYGLLYWLMKEIQEDSYIKLQIIVTGMHLSPEFGLTYQTIEQDGFKINEKVEMLLSSDTPAGIAKSMGLGLIGFADALVRLKPDILVLLGDRFEIFVAAQAGMVAKIPIAHIHGGETTEGAFDEAIRHSITKMAHFHFAAAELYRRRIIQLGESPKRVFNYGAIGLDNINKLKLLEKDDFEKAINFKLGSSSFLITYHPVTLGSIEVDKSINELFKAIDHFSNVRILFTKSNADTAGRKINQQIDEYAKKNPERVKVFTSMGQLLYLSAIKHTYVVIGNSSSGIIEVPAFLKPTINIGKRQQGRLRADSIIDCEENETAIVTAIKRALSSDFQEIIKKSVNPYGQGNVSFKIKEYLKNVSLHNIIIKRFNDIDYKDVSKK